METVGRDVPHPSSLPSHPILEPQSPLSFLFPSCPSLGLLILFTCLSLVSFFFSFLPLNIVRNFFIQDSHNYCLDSTAPRHANFWLVVTPTTPAPRTFNPLAICARDRLDFLVRPHDLPQLGPIEILYDSLALLRSVGCSSPSNGRRRAHARYARPSTQRSLFFELTSLWKRRRMFWIRAVLGSRIQASQMKISPT